MPDLTKRETHFEFGANWAEFATVVDQDRIQSAIAGLARLVPDLSGKTFVDIGSGSGLSALAAIRLGASEVLALDIDENSVATTRSLLSRFAPNAKWRCEKRSVFDLAPESIGTFDVVHSWGVLHHTGDMYRAIETAAGLLKPGGTFVLAIYAKTRLCGFWRAEKAFYSSSPRIIQAIVRAAYLALYTLRVLARRENPLRFFRQYHNRGMRFSTDVHDWLGGFPYESATPEQIKRFLVSLGLAEVRSFVISPPPIGLLGTGCDEYVYQVKN